MQSQKQARSLKFRILEEERFYYPCSENKGADQLHREADLRLCFSICRFFVFLCSGSYILCDSVFLTCIIIQVLPCLAEVIRWYDINLLVSVWNSYLIPVVPTCLMTYTAALLLKESVIHAVKLVPLLHKPPVSWQVRIKFTVFDDLSGNTRKPVFGVF